MNEYDCSTIRSNSTNKDCAIVLKMNISSSTWCYISLFTKDTRNQHKLRARDASANVNNALLPMSMLIVSWTATEGYTPLRIMLCGQRQSCHKELMLNRLEATYFCILFADPIRRGGLPIRLRIFSSKIISNSMEIIQSNVLPLTNLLHSCLLSLCFNIRKRVILSDEVELFEINDDDTTIIEVHNTKTTPAVIKLVYRPHAKTTQIFPKKSMSVISSNNDKGGDDRKELCTQLVSVHSLSKRVVAMGIHLSKYTDVKAFQLVQASIHTASITTNQESVKETCSWLFGQISLF